MVYPGLQLFFYTTQETIELNEKFTHQVFNLQRGTFNKIKFPMKYLQQLYVTRKRDDDTFIPAVKQHDLTLVR